MIDVSDILYDSDFSQDYTVHRKSGTWVNGRFEQNENPLPFCGVIIPANAQEIKQFPEADRVTGMMCFYSEQEIYTTHADNGQGYEGTSDEIEWRGARYKIINVTPYSDFGYFKAYGVYMESD